MATKRTNKDQYLKLRNNVWWYQRRVPKALKHLYPDIGVYSVSLKTSDIYVARKLRDQVNAKFSSTELVTVNEDAKRFRNLVRELEAERQINSDWDMPFYPDRLIERKDFATLHAYETVKGKRNHSHLYAFTLKEAYADWLIRHGKNKTDETQRKVKQTLKEYLNFLDVDDFPIKEVTRRSAYEFLHHIEASKARTTCQAFMSRLKSLWEHAKDLGEVEGDNPFVGHNYTAQGEVKKKQMFEPTELRQLAEIMSLQSPTKRLYFFLALNTGCRLSELGNLRKKHLLEKAGVDYVFIEKGKTSSATRNVPIPTELAAELHKLAENIDDEHPLLGLQGKAYGRWFSVLKNKHITKDSTKSFHSFRGMFITALKRCDVPEYIAAEIVGHERGSTMSYGYYAKDNEIQKLYEHSKKAVEYIKREWLKLELVALPDTG